MQTSKTDPQPRLRLTEARNRRGWSQLEVAERIGTTHVNVSRWERGITRPSPYFRRRLCKLFNKSEEDLDLQAAPEYGTLSGIEGSAAPESPTATAPPGTGPLVHASPSGPLSPAIPAALYDPAIPLRPATPLVGRDDELARIRERLRAGGSVALTALNGLPGVGKTALAIALAHDPDLRTHFADGVLWAGLGPNPNVQGVLSRWGALLGLSPAEIGALDSPAAWANALHNAIGNRAMLLVIDDAWTIEDALTFKIGGPYCAHLVTTRFPAIATQVTIGGATLIHELNEEESMALLRLLAPEVVNLEAARAADLVHALGGLPLALTLMGNYLRKISYAGQARRITAALERLSRAEERLHISEPRGPVEMHPSLPGGTQLSLQSVIAVSDQQLDEQARSALYALAVFPPRPDSFSEEAALAVAECSVDALDALSDAGLLESSGSGRYTLHQIIADYARLHLDAEPRDAKRAAQERLVAFVTAFVEEHRKDYELLEVESKTILAALEAAYNLGQRAALVRSVIACAPFLLLRGLYQLAGLHLRRAQDAAAELNDQRALAAVLLYLGEVAQQQGHYDQAEAAYQQGLALARKAGDKERVCALLYDLGRLIWKRGEYMRAEAYLQEGLALARRIDDKALICGILRILGSIAGNRGEFALSEAYLQEGLALAREIGDREQMCVLLSNLGAAVSDQGHFEQAKAYQQEGLAIARQIGDREQTCVLLANLGDIEIELGDFAQAEACFQEGLMLARQIGLREWIGPLLINLGIMTRKQGDYARAEACLQESIDLARQIDRPLITAHALNECGNLYLDQGQPERAGDCFREMLATIPEGDQDLLALARYGLARAAAAQGDLVEARRLGEASASALAAMGHHYASEVRAWLDGINE
jgi:tetratricopeptide (TPR) repeat protein/transcriptional regulator with XRE-family HTH domain